MADGEIHVISERGTDIIFPTCISGQLPGLTVLWNCRFSNCLKAYIHEDHLVMICRDDGAGMTQAALSELSQLLEQKENRSRHSGLYNIHRRIQLLYGHPYGVEIRSTEGRGTTLIITLPARREENIC